MEAKVTVVVGVGSRYTRASHVPVRLECGPSHPPTFTTLAISIHLCDVIPSHISCMDVAVHVSIHKL